VPAAAPPGSNRDLADADREVPAFFGEIDAAVVQAEIDGDARMTLREIGKARGNLADAKDKRHVEPQHPARLDPLRRNRSVGSFYIGKDALAGFEVAATGFGDRKLPRGAMEQLDAQSRFERGKVLCDHGLRETHGPPGRGQAAGSSDFCEYFEAGQPVRHELSHSIGVSYIFSLSGLSRE
jgi:hypothetical protein